MLKGSAAQYHANAQAQGEIAELSAYQDLRVVQVERGTPDIQEMRVDLETEVIPVSMEPKVSRVVLDQGAPRVVADIQVKRETLEILA